MKNKKLIILPLLLVLASCGPSVEVDNSLRTGETSLKIISCNDYHGVVDPDYYPGVEKWGAKIKSLYNEDKENTIVLSAGDMFQGSGVSSLTNGKVVVDAMNYLKFDAMAIGNHEFDWGVDVLKSAHDGIENNYSYEENKEANPEASFPYLGCNIYYNNGTEDEDDDTFCDFAEKYKVIARGGLRIGLVGYIGTDQLRSIVSTIGGQFSFHEPVEEIKETVKELRNKEKCDLVIAIGHDGHDSSSSYNSTNSELASLTGSYKDDLILNAHTHASYIDNLGNNVYAIQSGQYGQKIGYTTIKYSFDKKNIVSVKCENIDIDSNDSTLIDYELSNIYFDHVLSVDKILNEQIGNIGTKIYSSSKNEIAGWTADCIAHITESDFGSVNTGGIRASGFPLNSGKFTYNDLIGIMPFDNCVVTCSMKGSDVSQVLKNSALCFDFELQANPSITSYTRYKVAFDEYSFGKYIEPRFYDIEDIVYTSYLVRDAMKKEIKHQYYDLGMNFNYSIPASF
ncbi:MAG: bifunctional metallophosphatase/5'-nucleotidase [Bacilli bacterium]